MTEVQIEVVAQRYGLDPHAPDSNLAKWNLVAAKRTTMVSLKLGENGLERYQISWVDSIKHRSVQPTVELCAVESGNAQREVEEVVP